MAKRFAGRFGYPADEPFRPGTFHADKLDEPFRWKKPRKIFVCSMADLFHESIPVEVPTTAKHLDGSIYYALNPQLASIFGVIAKCQHHRFMMLTKRPKQMKAVIDRFAKLKSHLIDTDERSLGDIRFEYGEEFPGLPLPNLWLGVTVCNQAEADAKIPVLLDTPAAGRFVSIEPMLGPVDLRQWLLKGRFYTAKCSRCGWIGSSEHCGSSDYWSQDGCECPKCCTECDDYSDDRRLDWTICGGETGPNARPQHPDWVRSLRDQCHEADVPFFFKNWGEWGTHFVRMQEQHEPVFRCFNNFNQWCNKASSWVHAGDVLLDAKGKICRNGGDMMEAAYPVVILSRVGKAAAGCELDGKEHKEFPEGLK